MTETEFVNKNKVDWKRLSELIKSSKYDTEELNKLFVKVSGDLSYAQTNYPRRMVRVYLNELVIGVFDKIHTAKKKNIFEQLINFYNDTLPKVIIRNQYAFIASLAIFLVATIIGIYSTFENPDFTRFVLGDQYMSMTEENIQNDDPMAVYKSKDESIMFLGITINNIRVAIVTFVFGIFTSIGTGLVLLYNGIMLGTFFTFFYIKGYLSEALLTVWIHGTIEISSIIIAGSAGIIMGNSIINPGSYTRTQSLTKGAREAFLIIASTIPMFIMAGFLESFVTRHTDMPTFVSISIIFVSLWVILWIYAFHPYKIYKSKGKNLIDLNEDDVINGHQLALKKTNEPIQATFVDSRSFYPQYIFPIAPFLFAVLMLAVYFQILVSDLAKDIDGDLRDVDVVDIWTRFIMLTTIITTVIFSMVKCHEIHDQINFKFWWQTIRQYFAGFFLAAILIIVPLNFNFWVYAVFYLLVPVTIPMSIVDKLGSEKPLSMIVGEAFSQHYSNYFNSLFVCIQLGVYSYIIVTIITNVIFTFVFNILEISQLAFEQYGKQELFKTYSAISLFMVMFLPFIYYFSNYKWKQTYYQKSSEDLDHDIQLFLNRNSA